MPIVPVMQTQVGDQLESDVQTALGSVLMEKGRTLSERDLEILRAFLIPEVEIVRRAGAEEEAAAGAEAEYQGAGRPQTKMEMLQREFAHLVKVLRKAFDVASSGIKPPVYEIRSGLKSLIEHIDAYNVISFQPSGKWSKEDVLLRNSVLCAMTSYKLAKWANFPEKDLMQVALAGLLHDIGNVRIDPAILNKTGRLTADELQEVRQHTVYGYRLLEGGTALNQGVWLAALQHHERIDGSGYPMKVTGDKIHPYAKIVAIADVYHAMTSNRNYKKAESPYLVLETLQAESFGKLDPLLVQTFVERATRFHIGVFVRLSDGRTGEIVFSDRNHPTRPMVNVHGVIVNLMQERHLHIREVFGTNS